jgi:hypothetical protein
LKNLQVSETVQSIAKKNRRYNPKSIGKPHIMSGLLKCGICGSNYVFCMASKRRGDKFYESGYYRCSTRNNIGVSACDFTTFRAISQGARRAMFVSPPWRKKF